MLSRLGKVSGKASPGLGAAPLEVLGLRKVVERSLVAPLVHVVNADLVEDYIGTICYNYVTKKQNFHLYLPSGARPTPQRRLRRPPRTPSRRPRQCKRVASASFDS